MIPPTVEQILAEPAGPRLDLWVTVHALGWNPGKPEDRKPDDWQWSTDDRLALGLVVELDATRFWLKQRKSAMIRQHWLQIIPDTRATSFTWIASFGDQPHEVTGETRAIAICRAALLWKLYPGG